MIWKDGFTASYYITIIDALTWRDIGRREITGGSINRAAGDLMQSADLDMTESIGEAWVRIWLDADQDGVTHVPLFTGITSAPTRDIYGRMNTYKVECYSVLKPADDILTERGYYIPADVPAPQAAARLLRGPAPVQVDTVADYPRLTESIVAEDGETNLTLARKVVDAIGWRIRVDGYGIIHIEQTSDVPVMTFDSFDNDVLELTLSDTSDWYSCPNVFRAVSGDLTAVARDDGDGPLSTATRGREIWAEESSVNLGTNESIAAYAYKRLKELQSPARTITYTRRFYPDITVGDIVRISYPEVGIDDTFRISTQSFELAYGCRTSEEAVRCDTETSL